MTVGSQVKGCFASIKNIEASLETLANKVQDVEAKNAYNEVQQIISQIKDDLKKQVIYLAREEPQYK
ncbi:DUF1657 domain-containing protein [Oceanobacillus bengalensis]|uniref:DUF1657 domain-containing protein n=1 Tax=Oceanobacillus bengalensis TaxID=1435466 RepID=A0A494Z1S1_9BACI|nr:DUF1657 domain-containing protein [Oceanobacillus bengalensis]RKQ16388.1 DUF1657 domain-containing protein [Oceanobacillus bengalensis]